MPTSLEPDKLIRCIALPVLTFLGKMAFQVYKFLGTLATRQYVDGRFDEMEARLRKQIEDQAKDYIRQTMLNNQVHTPPAQAPQMIFVDLAQALKQASTRIHAQAA